MYYKIYPFQVLHQIARLERLLNLQLQSNNIRDAQSIVNQLVPVNRCRKNGAAIYRMWLRIRVLRVTGC